MSEEAVASPKAESEVPRSKSDSVQADSEVARTKSNSIKDAFKMPTPKSKFKKGNTIKNLIHRSKEKEQEKMDVTRTVHFEAWKLGQMSQPTWRWWLGIHGGHDELGSSRMIHPLSPFALQVHAVSMVFIVYGIFIAPYHLAFHWSKPECFLPDSIPVDMAAEICFILETLLSFCTGTYTVVDGNYYDTLPEVAKRYIAQKDGFFFDAVTALPFSWFDYFAIKQFCDQDSDKEGLSRLQWAKLPLRFLRPLRVLKVVRMVRIVKTIKSLNTRYTLDFWVRKLLLLVFSFLILTHLTCCGFWLMKEVYDESLDEFLPYHGVGEEDSLSKYVLSLYFVNTVFTTVGFGDIAGTNTNERIFVIFLMWIGLFGFAIIVGEVQALFEKLNGKANSRSEKVQDIQWLCKSLNIDPLLTNDILHWARFAYMAMHEYSEVQSTLEMLPKDLQERFVLQINCGILLKIPLMANIRHHETKSFAAALLHKAPFMLYRAKELIATLPDIEDCLYMIRAGAVRVRPKGEEDGDLLVAGDYFGEFACVEDWRYKDMDEIAFEAERSTEIQIVTRASIFEALKQMPASFRKTFNLAVVQEIRKASKKAADGEEAPQLDSAVMKAFNGRNVKLSHTASLQYDRWAAIMRKIIFVQSGFSNESFMAQVSGDKIQDAYQGPDPELSRASSLEVGRKPCGLEGRRDTPALASAKEMQPSGTGVDDLQDRVAALEKLARSTHTMVLAIAEKVGVDTAEARETIKGVRRPPAVQTGSVEPADQQACAPQSIKYKSNGHLTVSASPSEVVLGVQNNGIHLVSPSASEPETPASRAGGRRRRARQNLASEEGSTDASEPSTPAGSAPSTPLTDSERNPSRRMRKRTTPQTPGLSSDLVQESAAPS